MDRAAWRLDRTVHPFAESLSPTDIRLTTNFHEESLDGVLSCLHEFGHGIYERQVDPAYVRSPLERGASAAFHESQSRLWENLVGRSLSTWKFFYPQLQQEFPDPFAHVPLETFHRALSKVQPSFQRGGGATVHARIMTSLPTAVLFYGCGYLPRARPGWPTPTRASSRTRRSPTTKSARRAVAG